MVVNPFRFAPILLFLALGSTAFAGKALKDPVTYLGQTMLPKADIVVSGSVVRANTLSTGATLTRFRIEKVLYGREREQTVLLISPDPGLFPPVGVPVAYFLCRRISAIVVSAVGSDSTCRGWIILRFSTGRLAAPGVVM